MINLIAGISFGILAILYGFYLLKEYYLDFSKEKPEDFTSLPKGLLGIGLLIVISIYFFIQYFE